MGDVIRFRPRHGARRYAGLTDQTVGAEQRSAEILLFTGVRYERHGEEAPVITSTQPPRRPKKQA